MRLTNTGKITLSLLFLSILSSCATTLNVQLTRPAELDLNGAETIAVLPIKPYEYYLRENDGTAQFFVGVFFQIFDRVGPDEKQLINQLQYEIENGLINSQYIDVVSATAVSRAVKNGTSNPADVYLTGEVTYFNIWDERTERREKIKGTGENGKPAEYKHIREYVRHVKMYFRYQIVDGASGRIISSKKVELTDDSGHFDNPGRLPSAYSMLEYDVSKLAGKILRELQPYTITKTITLLKDKSKNEAFQIADELAKDGYINESLKAFYILYIETEMMEAGYNAAMLYEAKGNFTEAEKLMSRVYKSYPNKTVAKGLADIQNEIKQAKRLSSQTEKNDTLDVDF